MEPDWQQATGVSLRALVPVNGKPMYRHVLDALRGVPEIEHVYIVGSLQRSEDYIQIDPGDDLMENVRRGLQAVQSESVLFATVDLPFLTSESVEYFLRASERSGADITYSVVPVALCRERFPQMKRTTIKSKEGELTGGNLFWAKREVALEQLPRLQALYAARKQPVKLAFQLGIGLLLRFLLAQSLKPSLLSLLTIERRISQITGMRGKAIICPYPEIGTDIDRLEHWQAVSNSTTGI
jgi:GTP:adenosylcobinamide-phosphate guanylyltransferase